MSAPRPGLFRTVLLSLGCALLLGILAFWPTPRWSTPRRPALRAPIVFDELQNLPPRSADPSRSPSSGP